jgi:hypothetical protein
MVNKALTAEAAQTYAEGAKFSDLLRRRRRDAMEEWRGYELK